MEKFARFIHDLEISNKTNDKIDAIVRYLDVVPEEDKIWLVALFTGKRPKRGINTKLLREWAIEISGIPDWLFAECYHSVGDLGETISLILPKPTHKISKNISTWINELSAISKQSDEAKKEYVLNAWSGLNVQERLIFNKLIGGGFRVGVSHKLLVNAISKHSGIEANKIMHSLMGKWVPADTNYAELINGLDLDTNISQPYPFCLAYPLEQEVGSIGEPEEWQAEWKWDGIRGQIIKRKEELFIWSRGEELITSQFPELEKMVSILPDGCVIDGEILAVEKSQVLSFNSLQKRLNRKNVSKKQQEETPIGFYCYDLLEFNYEDWREKPLGERRSQLEKLISALPENDTVYLSQVIGFKSWEQLATIREGSREMNSEGLMLKKRSSPYSTGRKRGDWWKWKIEPFSIDAVMIYAQKGAGRRSNFYTDYTFAVKDGDKLLSIAKAYSGLTDKEIREVDNFVKRNAIEKFGPVRTVKPELVFEIAFEGIAESGRHKAGIALRFPRIRRWRKDKKADEINTIDDLRNLLNSTRHADRTDKGI
ncbi:ATP-dependent DNA ligase [Ferruginibacter sp. HRS2-29]|uniref:ATP-dependent DNA ligase n=1 Tax=Ferruginibacter sp. HRS2-29 TaxID=2487334 RepID=UPI0020CDF4DE|nr:ATP-dependent DNA ligase [Ferruginibacter sp. HRS2-29]MCP9752108.1 ATP-dependent DNA ligase [Ferruginibacter sp. HRS2-29]